MTRIHPRHHVSRRNRVPAPHPESTAGVIEAIGRAFRELFAKPRQADYSIAPHGLIPPIAIGPGIQRAVECEQQLAKLNALIPSLDHEQVDAILDLITVGADAADMRILARNTQIGQTL